MSTSSVFSNWWVTLIQGILMLALSILIFNNPGALLLTLALWLGCIVIASGIYGVIAYFATSKNNRSLINLLGSIAMVIVGFMMLMKMIISMMAITIAFGSMVAVIGIGLIAGSWNAKKHFSMWWLTALLGIAVLVTGIDSIINVQSGAESISSLLGISVMLSGFGLISLAFLKRKIVKAVQAK